jgi:hypothetical protein
METEASERKGRRVRLQLARGTVSGRLSIGCILRTLDDLNMVARHFVTLDAVEATAPDWSFDDGPLALAKTSILFVQELDEYAPKADVHVQARHFARAPLRLRVGAYTLQGFLHVPPGGDPLARLNQDSHAFIALTSVSVLGPDTEFVASFLAVNRAQIGAAQQIAVEEPADAVACEAGDSDA